MSPVPPVVVCQTVGELIDELRGFSRDTKVSAFAPYGTLLSGVSLEMVLGGPEPLLKIVPDTGPPKGKGFHHGR